MRTELDHFPDLTDSDRGLLTDNVGAAIQSSRQLGANGDQIASAARTAFVDSMGRSLWIAAGLALCASVVAFTQLPRPSSHGAHGSAAAEHGDHPLTATLEIVVSTEASAS